MCDYNHCDCIKLSPSPPLHVSSGPIQCLHIEAGKTTARAAFLIVNSNHDFWRTLGTVRICIYGFVDVARSLDAVVAVANSFWHSRDRGSRLRSPQNSVLKLMVNHCALDRVRTHFLPLLKNTLHHVKWRQAHTHKYSLLPCEVQRMGRLKKKNFPNIIKPYFI